MSRAAAARQHPNLPTAAPDAQRRLAPDCMSCTQLLSHAGLSARQRQAARSRDIRICTPLHHRPTHHVACAWTDTYTHARPQDVNCQHHRQPQRAASTPAARPLHNIHQKMSYLCTLTQATNPMRRSIAALDGHRCAAAAAVGLKHLPGQQATASALPLALPLPLDQCAQLHQ